MNPASTLLIEDNEVFAKSLNRRFVRAKVALDWATDWSTGYDAFAIGAYELVIADYNLKDSHHGLKLLKKVKALSPGTRLILISGELNNDAERLVEQSGIVDAYYVKQAGITDALLEEGRAAAERYRASTDWPALAEAILEEQKVDYEKVDEVDTLLQEQIDE